jgi:hypothetical protein
MILSYSAVKLENTPFGVGLFRGIFSQLNGGR